jgi:hypothetical protein
MTTTYDIFLSQKSFDWVLIVQQPVGQLIRFVSTNVCGDCASVPAQSPQHDPAGKANLWKTTRNEQSN